MIPQTDHTYCPDVNLSLTYSVFSEVRASNIPSGNVIIWLSLTVLCRCRGNGAFNTRTMVDEVMHRQQLLVVELASKSAVLLEHPRLNVVKQHHAGRSATTFFGTSLIG